MTLQHYVAELHTMCSSRGKHIALLRKLREGAGETFHQLK